jgi:hypothetical protein
MSADLYRTVSGGGATRHFRSNRDKLWFNDGQRETFTPRILQKRRQEEEEEAEEDELAKVQFRFH